MDSQPQPDYSARFALPQGIYLLNHSVGCLPHSSRRAAEACLDLWALQGGDAWYGWLDHIEGFRTNLASLLGTTREQICPQQNVSSGLAKLLTALPREAGRRRILLSELDFPTIGFACEHGAPEGVSVDYLRDADGRLPLELWDSALSEDTWLVVITHAYSNNSFLAPVEEICRIARSRGIHVIVDIAQSAGVVPIDVEGWQADAVIGSSVKWLCGGSGACFLWLRADHMASLEPTDVGWFSHENPFEYDIHSFRFAPDARRFWGGTPAVITYAIAGAAIGEIVAIGPGVIRAHNQSLTERLRLAATERGLNVTSPADPAERGGTLAIDFGDNSAKLARLRERGIALDARARFGIRFSPHIYNSAAQIEDVIAAL